MANARHSRLRPGWRGWKNERAGISCSSTLEPRAEQVRQLKTIDLTNKGYQGKRLVIQALTAAAAVFAAGGVIGGLIVKILGG
jgi:hypothetical protein